MSYAKYPDMNLFAGGLAHDWKIEGPVPQDTAFPIRRITTPDYLDDFSSARIMNMSWAPRARGLTAR